MATEAKTREPKERVVPRLKTKFQREVAPALREQFRYDNPMQVPTLRKIVINMGWARRLRSRRLGTRPAITTIAGRAGRVRHAPRWPDSRSARASRSAWL